MGYIERSVSSEEVIRGRGRISTVALLIAWLAIPLFIIVIYGGGIYTAYKQFAVIANVTEALNLGEFFRSIPLGVTIVLAIPFILLFIVWLGWGLITTKRHFNFEFAYTDNRVLARNGNETFDSKLSEIKNVFVQQSVWGKLFSYGTITIAAKCGSITVKNVCHPIRLKNILLEKTDQEAWRV